MTDAHTQALRRAAAAGDPQAGARALAAELRAGTIKFDLERARDLYACRDPKPYTTVREVGCPDCSSYTRPRTDCNACGATGTLPCDPWNLLRLRAYLVDEGARVLVPTLTDRGLVSAASGPLPDWLAGIERLASKLPPTRVEVECPDCGGMVARGGVKSEHRMCNGTGKVPHDTPAEHWLLVVAAHAVCREYAPEAANNSFPRGPYVHRDAMRTLDACAAWLACPCPKHEPADMDAYPAGNGWWLWWVMSDPKRAVQSRAKILGDDRTRKLAAQAVLEVLR